MKLQVIRFKNLNELLETINQLKFKHTIIIISHSKKETIEICDSVIDIDTTHFLQNLMRKLIYFFY